MLAGCAIPPGKPTGKPSYALTNTGDTSLGTLAAASPGADSGQSTLCILDGGEEAFVSRIALIDLAERSIDVQTYCWYSDSVGRRLAERLIRAADRGVRVRILLDDLDAAGRDFNIATLDAIPNVEVRLYNPFRVRFFTRLLRAVELLVSLDRLDHRMHNKTFVVDNQAAVIGGRNIADQYFGVNPVFNYRDLDLLAFGKAAAQVSDCFDAYWANDRSYPIRDVFGRAITPAELDTARRRLHDSFSAERASFAYRLPDTRRLARKYISDMLRNSVAATTEVLFDDPRKGDIHAEQPSYVREVLTRTPPTSEVVLANPYFVPQERLVSALEAQRDKGVAVRILTNSLASTDVALVHASYAKRRKRLLSAGIGLWELRPDAESRHEHCAPNCRHATLALHAKAMVLDRQRVFVGSMNLDPRSHKLNTEDGILAYSPQLARQVTERLDVDFSPANSWRLSLDDGKVIWETIRAGARETSTDEPETSWWQRVKCQFLKLLPIEEEI